MSRRLAIGIDIGGTKIAVAAIDDAAQIHARDEIATEAQLGFDRALGRMVDTIDRTLERSGWSRHAGRASRAGAHSDRRVWSAVLLRCPGMPGSDRLRRGHRRGRRCCRIRR
ncbi:MAG: hypothetical protein WD669_00395 [Pirellulales bacterium]